MLEKALKNEILRQGLTGKPDLLQVCDYRASNTREKREDFLEAFMAHTFGEEEKHPSETT